MNTIALSARHILFGVVMLTVSVLTASSTFAQNNQKPETNSANYQENAFPNGTTVRVGVSHNPPLSYQGNGAAPQGFITDIIRDVAKAEGWNLVFIERSWPELLNLLESGKIDLLGGIAYTPARANKYSFSEEAAANNWAVVYRSKTVTIDSITDLQGKRVALLPKGVHSVALRELAKSFGITFGEVAAPDYAKTLELVDKGEADVGVVARTFHILHGAEYKALVTDVRFNPIEIRFAAPKQAGNVLLAAFDVYLSTQKNDPSSQYNRLLAKWFTGPGKEVVPVWLYWVIAGIVALLSATWLGVILLRHTVEVRTAELKESEQRFHDFAMSASDWMWELDENLRYTHLPENFEKVTKVKLENALGKTRWELFKPDPNDEVWRQHQVDVEAHRPFRDFINKVPDPEGRMLHFAISGNPRFDESGKFLGYCGTGKDITLEVEAQVSANEAEEKLVRAQKIETVGTLARGIAHDVNNILTPIINYADLILETDVKEKKIKEWASKILISAQRAADLIQQIQTFSRQASPKPQLLSLAPLIKETLKLMRSSTPKTIQFVTEIDPQCALASIDPTQVHQVMMNLCVNAVHAMEDNDGVLTIALSPVHLDEGMALSFQNLKEGDYIRLSVHDTGHGIDRETRQKIFDPFFTTKEQGKGTGLGLSTVYGIVTAHGGEIAVYSEPDEGTTFFVYLPAHQEGLSTPTAKEAPVQGGQERVLVVDDEEDNTASIGEVLTRLGYEATLFNDSEMALAAFTATPGAFDLVITDQSMPKMTGKVLAEKLLAIQPDFPVLMMTGYGETEVGQNLNGTGIRGVIFKPLSKVKLDKAIRSALLS